MNIASVALGFARSLVVAWLLPHNRTFWEKSLDEGPLKPLD